MDCWKRTVRSVVGSEWARSPHRVAAGPAFGGVQLGEKGGNLGGHPLLLREVHAPQQVLEAGVGTQGVEVGIHPEVNDSI